MTIWTLLKLALVIVASLRGRFIVAVLVAALPFAVRWMAIYAIASDPESLPARELFTAITGATVVSFTALFLLAIYPERE